MSLLWREISDCAGPVENRHGETEVSCWNEQMKETLETVNIMHKKHFLNEE